MIATSERRLYSTILAQFSWYSQALTMKPESILAHGEKLSEFEASYPCKMLITAGFEQRTDISIVVI